MSTPSRLTSRSLLPSCGPANAEGLRMTRMGIYLARTIRLEGFEEYEREKQLIGREVRPVVEKVLDMGDGDVALGSVRAIEAGVLDIPWSPNRHVKSRVLPGRPRVSPGETAYARRA